MEFRVKTGALAKTRTDCLITHIYADKTLSSGATIVNDLCRGAIVQLIKQNDISLKPGSSAWLPAPEGAACKRILVVCLNKQKQTLTLEDIQSATGKIVKALDTRAIRSAVWAMEPSDSMPDKALATAIAQSVVNALYRYSLTKTKDVKAPALTSLTLQAETKLSTHWKKGLDTGAAVGTGVNLTRELGNLPGNICTPTYLAEQARAMAKESPALTTKIVDSAQMKKLGMGALLSVAAGSEQPPKLICMEYKGGKTGQAPIVLVGKGITFDTGGISLKPGAAMDEMKFDMCGAATVFGVLKALTQLKAPINVVGLVAAAENMPSGRATKPGDVVTSMSGQTIEVLNTDAEGRLVLCDTLTYAERFKPKHVIDIATLTGACVIALGSHASGLYANDQGLADALLEAGNKTRDRFWQMPLWDDYQKSLDSNFADMANIGGREGGSITAACFLARYTKAYKWAHLDIAGTAWRSGGAKGATGRPVSALLQHLLNIY